MTRLVAVALSALVGVIAGDLLFRSSLLDVVRPTILEPTDGASVELPVRLRWEGPRRMRVALRHAGREHWDLGVHESPVELPVQYFDRKGLYDVEVRSPTFGEWISSSRAFSIKDRKAVPEPPKAVDVASGLSALQRSLRELQLAQEDMRDENTDLYEENAAIREENAILTQEVNRLAEAEQRAAGQVAAIEAEHLDLVAAYRQLLEETNQLRLRFASVIPCTVWGYYSFPRPQTIPPTRRQVTVSNTKGDVFRSLEECEEHRQADPTRASPCFCVGNSWGG